MPRKTKYYQRLLSISLIYLIIFYPHLTHASAAKTFIAVHGKPDHSPRPYMQEWLVQGATAESPNLQDVFSGFYHQGPVILDEDLLNYLRAKKSYAQKDYRGCLTWLDSNVSVDNERPFNDGYLPASFVLKGQCDEALGNSDGAKKVFQQALTLNPNIQTDTPIFRQAAIDLPEVDGISLTVTSEPPFADVILNGRYLGKTPLSIPLVPQGLHHLHLHAQGQIDGYQRLRVDPNYPEIKNVFMELKPVAEDYPKHLVYWSGFQEKEKIQELKEFFGWEKLVLFFPEGSSVREEIYDCSWGELVATRTFEVTPDEPKIAIDIQPQEDELPMRVQTTDLHEPIWEDFAKDKEPGKKPVYKKWWFWSALAVLAAGAATGMALAMQGGDSGNGYLVGPPLGNPNAAGGVVVGR